MVGRALVFDRKGNWALPVKFRLLVEGAAPESYCDNSDFSRAFFSLEIAAGRGMARSMSKYKECGMHIL